MMVNEKINLIHPNLYNRAFEEAGIDKDKVRMVEEAGTLRIEADEDVSVVNELANGILMLFIRSAYGDKLNPKGPRE